MIEKLIAKIEEEHSPIVMGLDPQIELLPPGLVPGELSLESIGEAFFTFNKALMDALAGVVPAVKPQIAMYERYGIPGLIAYQKTLAYAKKKGFVVIADVKRGDIGSTSKAYAEAHLGKVQLGEKSVPVFDADFATVNLYLGTEGIEPFRKVCEECDKGLFVLVKTSNPGSAELQDRMVEEKPLYLLVGEAVEEWGKPLSHGRYSDIGAVVGATHPETGAALREALPHTFFLVPGYGAQGASGKDLAGFFDKEGGGVIVNSSRGIIGAWKKPEYESFGAKRFAEAARKAAEDMREDINSYRM